MGPPPRQPVPLPPKIDEPPPRPAPPRAPYLAGPVLRQREVAAGDAGGGGPLVDVAAGRLDVQPGVRVPVRVPRAGVRGGDRLLVPRLHVLACEPAQADDHGRRAVRRVRDAAGGVPHGGGWRGPRPAVPEPALAAVVPHGAVPVAAGHSPAPAGAGSPGPPPLRVPGWGGGNPGHPRPPP